MSENIPLNQSTMRSSNNENLDDLAVEKAPEEKDELKLRYCLCINDIPEYQFKNLEAARIFLTKLIENKLNDLEEDGHKARSEDDGGDRVRIVGSSVFMFFINYTYTIESYEIFEMVKIGDANMFQL